MNDPIIFVRRTDGPAPAEATLLALDFEARRKRHQAVSLADGREGFIRLERLERPLAEGDVLHAADGQVAVVAAAPEALLRVEGDAMLVARAAYHLGNRHASVALVQGGLETPADPVMRVMLEQMGAHVSEVLAPFRPEIGAYHHEHDHAHGPGKIHRFVRLA